MSGHAAWAVVTHAALPNGPAHRLVEALRDAGHEVAFCARPLVGASRWRAERSVPGRGPSLLVDEARPVPLFREPLNTLELGRFAWQVASVGRRELLLVGCDPVAFLEAAVAFAASPLRVRAKAAWFVDWSAQRLTHPVSAAAYRLATRGAVALADVSAAITPAAAAAVASTAGHSHDVMVLANQPLHLGTGPPWAQRRQAVAYVGGLSAHQGVDILIEAGTTLAREDVVIDIVGDGPATGQVARAASNQPGIRFHGLLADRAALASVMLTARVGWALYDPSFPMHSYNDPLKVKDYLAAGMRVVSTLPTGTSDEAVTLARYNVTSLVAATREALFHAPTADPTAHPSLIAAAQSLQSFVDALAAA